jgi:DNA-binding CsgD family transcriptional regulator
VRGDPIVDVAALARAMNPARLFNVGNATQDGTVRVEPIFRKSVDRLGKARLRSEAARGQLLYGEWLRRKARRTDARGQLRAAYDALSSMGLDGFAERARHELLATGAVVRRQHAAMPSSLTDQETVIARLAGEGFSKSEIGKPLFLSPRTVEGHLRKIFSKLGVASRRELRGARLAT